MTTDEIPLLVQQELHSKTFGITEQYLEILSPIYEDQKLKIDWVDRDKEDGSTVVYIPVDEYFSLAVMLDEETEEILGITTESRNHVSLRVTSEPQSSKELMSLTKLKPTRFWDKGDYKLNKRLRYDFSCIEFTPNPEPDEVEDKIEKLLSYLESDKKGILSLPPNAYIQVVMDFHYGNQLLGDLTLKRKTLQRLSDLQLEISFDFTA